MDATKVAYLTSFAISILTILANSFGLYLLSRLERPFSNQVKIIMSISFLEILIPSNETVSLSLAIFVAKQHIEEEHIYWKIRTSLYLVWYMQFYILMIDRLLGCSFPFWYRGEASSKWMKNGLICCWTSLLVIALIFFLEGDKSWKKYVFDYAWVTLDILFIIIFVALYGTLFFMKRRSNRQVRRQNVRAENKRFMTIISLILFVFLILEAIPTITMTALRNLGRHSLAKKISPFFEVVWRLNLLADPLIYIFMQPKLFRKHCFVFMRNRSTVNADGRENERSQSHVVSTELWTLTWKL